MSEPDGGRGLGYRLRRVTMADAETLLEWVNDPDDRANSFSGAPIAAGEHAAWLERSLADPDMHLFVMTDGVHDVGHIKMRVSGPEGEVGYCIAPEWRGRGLAREMIRLMTDEASRMPEVERVVADVKPSNAASRKALLGAGYTEASVRYSLELGGGA